MDRPRILLVPDLTELEWAIKPSLEEWADVASYDAPGVGGEPAPERFNRDAVVKRGLEELDRRGWDRCVVVGDEFGAATAARIAGARPEAVQGLALGHPALELTPEGPRPTLNREVLAAFRQLLRTDYRAFVRALTQVTQGGYDDALADLYIDKVPFEVNAAYTEEPESSMREEALEPVLRRLEGRLLLAEHDGCLLWTTDSYEDVVATFPHAHRASFRDKPSVSPDFVEALRTFCRETIEDALPRS